MYWLLGCRVLHRRQHAGDGMESLFAAAKQAGAARLVVLSSLNSKSCREEFEGFRVRERALDRIQLQYEAAEQKESDPGTIAVTVIGSSMFFKDTIRIIRSW